MSSIQSAQTWITYSFTCKLDLACLFFVSVHQMAPPVTEVADIRLQLYCSFIDPRRDERLSLPGWLTYSGRFTHEWSSAGQGSSPAIDRRSTAVPRNQPRAHFSVYYYIKY